MGAFASHLGGATACVPLSILLRVTKHSSLARVAATGGWICVVAADTSLWLDVISPHVHPDGTIDRIFEPAAVPALTVIMLLVTVLALLLYWALTPPSPPGSRRWFRLRRARAHPNSG